MRTKQFVKCFNKTSHKFLSGLWFWLSSTRQKKVHEWNMCESSCGLYFTTEAFEGATAGVDPCERLLGEVVAILAYLSTSCLLLRPNPTWALQLVSPPNQTLVFLPVWWRVWRGEHTRLLKTEVGENENFGEGMWLWEVQDDVDGVKKSASQANLVETVWN